MIIKLAGGRNIVVDAKASILAYVEALECTDEAARAQKMKDHARQVRDQLLKLSAKSYWDQFKPSPEFVILFIPGEPFYNAALQEDPMLLELGIEKKIILTSPTSLIAVLRAAAMGWKEEKLAENAQKISDLGQELYDRMLPFVNHVDSLRSSLEKSVDSYNKMAGSLETRLLPAARRFKELGTLTGEEIATVTDIERTPRTLQTEAVPLLRSIEPMKKES